MVAVGEVGWVLPTQCAVVELQAFCNLVRGFTQIPLLARAFPDTVSAIFCCRFDKERWRMTGPYEFILHPCFFDGSRVKAKSFDARNFHAGHCSPFGSTEYHPTQPTQLLPKREGTKRRAAVNHNLVIGCIISVYCKHSTNTVNFFALSKMFNCHSPP